jgi:hypothetical protein
MTAALDFGTLTVLIVFLFFFRGMNYLSPAALKRRRTANLRPRGVGVSRR